MNGFNRSHFCRRQPSLRGDIGAKPNQSDELITHGFAKSHQTLHLLIGNGSRLQEGGSVANSRGFRQTDVVVFRQNCLNVSICLNLQQSFD